jgi:type IV secretory pathway VirB6-like protein
VVWYGIKAALAAGEHRGGFHFANFVTLILMISFGFAMVNYYDAPIPGFGRDFHHLITDEAASLSNQIGQANAQRIADDTSYVLGNLEAPGITQPIATFLYALLWLAAVVTEGLALIVVAFGVVATAVCILLGPVFIPFFIVPQLDWLFWGWLKAFIQYAFYQVVAAGVLYIVSQFTYGIIHAQITGLISPTDLIRISPVLVVMYLAAIYAIIKVPMLTSHIFSGTSGGSAMVIFEKVACALGAEA